MLPKQLTSIYPFTLEHNGISKHCNTIIIHHTKDVMIRRLGMHAIYVHEG
jgi:hypothetical protein